MATSISEYSYGALTEWRNSYADEQGHMGRFTRVAFECGYVGLIPVGALETAVHAVYFLAIKGASFLGCFIPLQCMMPHLTNLDTYLDQVVRLRVISSATTTTVSALSLVGNLWGSFDGKALAQTVKKYADKCLVSDFNSHKTAKPFSTIAFKALIAWRNDFVDRRTGEIFTTTKVFKQLSVIPLCVGVAAFSALETLVRGVYALAILVFLVIPVFYALMPLGYVFTILLDKATCGNLISYNPIDQLLNHHMKNLVGHGFWTLNSAGYALGTGLAALISLKDNFMKNSDRVYEPLQMHHKKQIDFALKAAIAVPFALAVPMYLMAFVAMTIFYMTVLPLCVLVGGIYDIIIAVLTCNAIGAAICKAGNDVLAKIDYCIRDIANEARVFGEAAHAAKFLIKEAGATVLECFTPSTYY
jgi:hypothetical protein